MKIKVFPFYKRFNFYLVYLLSYLDLYYNKSINSKL